MAPRRSLFPFSVHLAFALFAFADPPSEPVLWEYATGGVIYSSATLGRDGTVYIGSGDNKVYALDSSGNEKWTFTAGDWVDAVPALSADESVVYIGSWDNKLYALDAQTGVEKWSYTTGNYIVASASVARDGTIYFGSNDNFFYALNPDGTLKWEYFLEGSETAEIQSSPAIAEDGTIYFGAKDGNFYALNPDGTPKWANPDGSANPYQVQAESGGNGEVAIISSPAIDDDGNLYFGAGSGTFHSLDPDGNLRWTHRLLDVSADDEAIDSPPAIGPDGNVYYATREGYLIALDSAGVELWSVYVGDVFYSAPTIDEEGIIYIPSFFGNVDNNGTSEAVSGITAVDSSGTILWEYALIYGYIDSSMSLDDAGHLYLGASDGAVVAFDTGSGNALATSEWPKHRGNRESNGRYSVWTYNLVASPSPAEGGIVSGTGEFAIGTVVQLQAVPASGYTFGGWSGDLTSTDNPLTFNISSNVNLTATFNLAQFSVSAISYPSSGGTVLGTGSYGWGTQAELEAEAAPGYTFLGWKGALTSQDNPVSFTVTWDTDVEARFVWYQPYTLTFTNLGSGWGLSDWLGVVYPSGYGWIYHQGFGWAYAKGESDGLWFWFPDAGSWYWTSSDTYPFLYSENASDWIYYHDVTGKFYHYSPTEQWLDTPYIPSD